MMGKGIDLAKDISPETAQLMEDFRDQLLIVTLNRLADQNGEITIPVSEVDATGQFYVEMEVDTQNFKFKVKKKD